MTTEQANMETVRSFIESFWNNGELGGTETYLASDYVDHAYTPNNCDGLKQMAGLLNAAFADQLSTIEQMIAQGGKVVARMVLRGVHSGSFRGTPPTGNAVEAVVYREYRLAEGKIAEHWALFDTAALLRQINAPLNPDNACKVKRQ